MTTIRHRRRASGHSAQYKAHLRSPKWRAIRQAALVRAGHRCALCGLGINDLRRRGRHLEVHHNNYRNLGHEQPDDLTVLCAGGGGGCHALADAQRRERTRTARQTRPTRRRRRSSRRAVRRALRPLRLPIAFIVFAGAMKVAAIVLPSVS